MIVDKKNIVNKYKLVNDKNSQTVVKDFFYDAPLLTKLVTTHFCHQTIFIDKIWILSDISGLSINIISVVVTSFVIPLFNHNLVKSI